MTNNDSLTKTVIDAVSYCSSVAGIAGTINAGIYAVPTMNKIIKNVSSEELQTIRNQQSDLEKKVENIGMIFGIGSIFLQLALYGTVAFMGHPEYLLIPVVTNYGSHFFEKSLEKN